MSEEKKPSLEETFAEIETIIEKLESGELDLDESFAFYDEKRLKETLKWLAENRTQMLLFTCQKREEEALKELGIPYQKIEL